MAPLSGLLDEQQVVQTSLPTIKARTLDLVLAETCVIPQLPYFLSTRSYLGRRGRPLLVHRVDLDMREWQEMSQHVTKTRLGVRVT